MGKGSKPRPTKKIKFDSNFDEINWKNPLSPPSKSIKTKLGIAKRFLYIGKTPLVPQIDGLKINEELQKGFDINETI
jgi:hypothetical protein